MAIDTEGMEPRMKVLELLHGFDGHTGEVVECYASYQDADMGYMLARSQLDALFGANCDSVVPLIRQISNGKQIAEQDYDGHMSLFTNLIKAEATAKQINQEEQLNPRDYIGEIAEGRVRHIAKDMWKKDPSLQ